jgi:hypothetical protein
MDERAQELYVTAYVLWIAGRRRIARGVHQVLGEILFEGCQF